MPRARPQRRRDAPKIAGTLKDNLILSFLCALSIAGVLWGGLAMRAMDIGTTESLAYLVSGFQSQRAVQSFQESFAASLASTGIFLCILYILGCCAIAAPLICFIAFFKGLGAGLVGSYLFAGFGRAATPHFLVILLPNIFLSTLLILFAARASVSMSTVFFRFLFPSDSPLEPLRDFRRYCISYAVFAVLCIMLAFLDALISTMLLPYFPL